MEAGGYETILYDKDGPIAFVTLNRPEKLNALTVELFKELREHVSDLKQDDRVCCVVLRGAGRCFSAGHDLGDIAEGEDVPSPGWHSETLQMMELLPKPVIAAVHGHCYTGALEVALAADFILASRNAKFADTHAKWALTPIWGMSQRLPRRVGIATAKRLMFTAETITAEAALRVGLCEAVFDNETFFDDVAGFCAGILANSSFSHAANKKLLEETDGAPLDDGLKWEVAETAGVGPDAKERIEAFSKR